MKRALFLYSIFASINPLTNAMIPPSTVAAKMLSTSKEFIEMVNNSNNSGYYSPHNLTQSIIAGIAHWSPHQMENLIAEPSHKLLIKKKIFDQDDEFFLQMALTLLNSSKNTHDLRLKECLSCEAFEYLTASNRMDTVRQHFDASLINNILLALTHKYPHFKPQLPTKAQLEIIKKSNDMKAAKNAKKTLKLPKDTFYSDLLESSRLEYERNFKDKSYDNCADLCWQNLQLTMDSKEQQLLLHEQLKNLAALGSSQALFYQSASATHDSSDRFKKFLDASMLWSKAYITSTDKSLLIKQLNHQPAHAIIENLISSTDTKLAEAASLALSAYHYTIATKAEYEYSSNLQKAYQYFIKAEKKGLFIETFYDIESRDLLWRTAQLFSNTLKIPYSVSTFNKESINEVIDRINNILTTASFDNYSNYNFILGELILNRCIVKDDYRTLSMSIELLEDALKKGSIQAGQLLEQLLVQGIDQMTLPFQDRAKIFSILRGAASSYTSTVLQSIDTHSYGGSLYDILCQHTTDPLLQQFYKALFAYDSGLHQQAQEQMSSLEYERAHYFLLQAQLTDNSLSIPRLDVLHSLLAHVHSNPSSRKMLVYQNLINFFRSYPHDIKAQEFLLHNLLLFKGISPEILIPDIQKTLTCVAQLPCRNGALIYCSSHGFNEIKKFCHLHKDYQLLFYLADIYQQDLTREDMTFMFRIQYLQRLKDIKTLLIQLASASQLTPNQNESARALIATITALGLPKDQGMIISVENCSQGINPITDTQSDDVLDQGITQIVKECLAEILTESHNTIILKDTLQTVHRMIAEARKFGTDYTESEIRKQHWQLLKLKIEESFFSKDKIDQINYHVLQAADAMLCFMSAPDTLKAELDMKASLALQKAMNIDPVIANAKIASEFSRNELFERNDTKSKHYLQLAIKAAHLSASDEQKDYLRNTITYIKKHSQKAAPITS